ncbi:MAG: transcriptional regulator NrdR [Pseudomonadota bacterium]
MRCPYCASEDTRVIDSRLGDGGESVRRRRECQSCTERFTTFENVVFQMPLVIKTDGRREKFDEVKLRRGIMRAMEKRPIDVETIEGSVNRIMRQFTHKGEREIPVARIGEAVMNELRGLDEVAYVRFASVYRRFQDLEAFSDEVQKLKDSLSSQPSKVQLSLFTGTKDR